MPASPRANPISPRAKTAIFIPAEPLPTAPHRQTRRRPTCHHRPSRKKHTTSRLPPAASQMGRHIAKLIEQDHRFQAAARKFSTAVPRPAFAYWDKGTMATIGRSKAVAAAAGFRFTGFIAWLMWLFVHLMFLIGMRNRVSVFLQWVWAYITWERGARIIVR